MSKSLLNGFEIKMVLYSCFTSLALALLEVFLWNTFGQLKSSVSFSISKLTHFQVTTSRYSFVAFKVNDQAALFPTFSSVLSITCQ